MGRVRETGREAAEGPGFSHFLLRSAIEGVCWGRMNAWLTLFSSSRLRPVGSGSPPLPVMSARRNQRSRALRQAVRALGCGSGKKRIDGGR